ncbi:U4/U6-U5 snRNP complex subunit lsm8 [Sparganum proliferum]
MPILGRPDLVLPPEVGDVRRCSGSFFGSGGGGGGSSNSITSYQLCASRYHSRVLEDARVSRRTQLTRRYLARPCSNPDVYANCDANLTWSPTPLVFTTWFCHVQLCSMFVRNLTPPPSLFAFTDFSAKPRCTREFSSFSPTACQEAKYTGTGGGGTPGCVSTSRRPPEPDSASGLRDSIMTPGPGAFGGESAEDAGKVCCRNKLIHAQVAVSACTLLFFVRMASELESYVGRLVNIITSDGRSIVGTLKGFDNVINLVVKDSHERVFSPIDGVERVPLGLFIIRGQNVAVIGEIDEDMDNRLDFSNLRAEPLNPIVH